MSNKKKKQQNHPPLSPRQKVVGGYLTLMFGVFPVFCTDGFFNIRHDRYYFFLALSLALLLFWGITILGGDRKNAIGKLQVPDWAMLGFLLVCILSTVCSVHPDKALLGTAGRNNGLILMAVYVGIYFAVSRYGKPGPAAFAALGIVSAFVSVLTVLNFFSLDPLKMLEPLTVSDRKIFFSTIGNKNLLSGYLCITLPVLTVLYVQDSPKWLRVLSLICLCPGFAALMAADSDSGLLGLGVFTMVYLVWYSRRPGRLKRLFTVWTVMLLSARLLQPFVALPTVQSKDLSQLQQFFVSSLPGLVLLILLAGLTMLLYLLDRKHPEALLPKFVPRILIGLLGALILAITVAAVYLTVHAEILLQGMWKHLRLDDTWGTNRGFMWQKTMEIYRNFPLWRKLLGSGPDTFYYMFQPYFSELNKYWTSSTNAAHNEYLNYLITVGLLGTAAYCTALISSLIRGWRGIRQDPMGAVYCAAVICYSAQAVVSIAQPITTPFLFLFLALCAGLPNAHAETANRR